MSRFLLTRNDREPSKLRSSLLTFEVFRAAIHTTPDQEFTDHWRGWTTGEICRDRSQTQPLSRVESDNFVFFVGIMTALVCDFPKSFGPHIRQPNLHLNRIEYRCSQAEPRLRCVCASNTIELRALGPVDSAVLLQQVRLSAGGFHSGYTSSRAFNALSSMNCRRGSTTSPMRMVNMRSASTALSSFKSTFHILRLSGFIVVS